jgi:ADP-ribose pyrophosphatase YjhB (NUDIX family)
MAKSASGGVTPRVRPSIKAVLVRDSSLLVIVNRALNGSVFYTLPGGGQEPLESAVQALERECLEEIGARVRVGELLYVRDYIARNHEFTHLEPNVHGLELMFQCDLEPGEEPRVGAVPDSAQTGVAWLPLEGLLETTLYPKVLRGLIARGDRSRVYLGDVN